MSDLSPTDYYIDYELRAREFEGMGREDKAAETRKSCRRKLTGLLGVAGFADCQFDGELMIETMTEELDAGLR